MAIKYIYGFSVNDQTNRVKVKEDTFFEWNDGVPQAVDGISCGVTSGEIVQCTGKANYTAEKNFLYQNLFGLQTSEFIVGINFLPMNKDGQLVMDSVSAIAYVDENTGLSMTGQGAIAIEL